MVRFQVLDFDTTSNVPDDLRSLWPDERSSPWIRICGRTADAESVVLYVAGFVPYLWVEVADSAAYGAGRVTYGARKSGIRFGAVSTS